MSDMFLSITVVLDCIAVFYTIYLVGKNHELVRDNAYLKRCLEDEKHKNYSRQIERAVIKGELAVKEQEIKLLREQLEQYGSNTQI